MHEVLKKYGSSKWKRNQKYLSRVLLEAKPFITYAMCKIEFCDYEFREVMALNFLNLVLKRY